MKKIFTLAMLFMLAIGMNAQSYKDKKWGDICSGTTIRCRKTDGLTPGTLLYRNISTEFEKILATRLCRRMIPVNVNVSVSGDADRKSTRLNSSH